MSETRPFLCFDCASPATTYMETGRWYCARHAEREQYIAMKVAEAWETWSDLLPEDADPMTAGRDWLAYKHGTEKLAGRAWNRQDARQRKRDKRTRSLDSLHEEPAAEDDHVRDLGWSDLIAGLTAEIREVIHLRLFGHTIDDVMSLTGLSRRTVTERICIAKMLLEKLVLHSK